jgi:ribosomal-protein-alanine N-acetyltransferase
VIIRQAKVTDLPSIMAIEETAFPDAERWTERAWADELARSNPDSVVFVVQSEERAGQWDDSPFAPQQDDVERSVDAVASFRRASNTLDVFRLMTAKDARRLGLATALVRRGIEWGRSRSVERVLLEVRSTNRAAQALYAAVGFTAIHERKNYYGTGVDAIVMELQIGPASDVDLIQVAPELDPVVEPMPETAPTPMPEPELGQVPEQALDGGESDE